MNSLMITRLVQFGIVAACAIAGTWMIWEAYWNRKRTKPEIFRIAEGQKLQRGDDRMIKFFKGGAK